MINGSTKGNQDYAAYAMVSIQSPEWGWCEDDDRRIVTGHTIGVPFAVKIPCGSSLVATLRTYHDYSPIYGDSIHTAIAMSQEDYDAYIAEVNKERDTVFAEF